MKTHQSMTHQLLLAFATALITATSHAASTALANAKPLVARTDQAIANPNIDAIGFLGATQAALLYRETRRIPVDKFLQLSRQPNVVILDARSHQRYRELHIKGATNLSFPDITAESLAQLIPDKNTPVLIYCNNNFAGEKRAFPTKLPSASLNLSTFVALHNYGYRNVYELGPLIDVKAATLPFEGTLLAK